MSDRNPAPGTSKTRLRKELRGRRRELGAAAQQAAALALVRQVVALPPWPGAQRIALYLAADGEIDTTPLSDLARAQGKELFLPVIEAGDTLAFAAWPAESPLLRNRYGIPEPASGTRRCPVTGLDIVFLPLVGWDRRGGRLGMGGGFYDRTLSAVAGSEARGPLLVGLAHTMQEAENIPREEWDIPLDFVATDTALCRCQGAP
jgi:5-formyltetrahydrofolate cyclo-ligase